jgi:alcohol dehydrogenase class IV
MEAFVYTGLPARVVFGDGVLTRLSDEISRLGAKSVMVITTPQQAADGQALAGTLSAYDPFVYAKATMHTPVEITEDALALVRERSADCLVALGGGSTIGLAKAIALRTDLPQIAIPTTYAGSEMTPILGETRDGLKTTHLPNRASRRSAAPCRASP